MRLFAIALWLVLSSPAFAQDGLCGSPPSLPTTSEVSESIKGQLQGQANLLTKYVGNAQLGGEIQAARKTIYQTSDKFFAAQKDAYLAYLFCLALNQDKTISAIDKIKAIKEFSQPAPIITAGITRQIGNTFLSKNNRIWKFKAPAGAIIEAIGLNCDATVTADDIVFKIKDNMKVPVPGEEKSEINVEIRIGLFPPMTKERPDSDTRCMGKFLVTAAD